MLKFLEIVIDYLSYWKSSLEKRAIELTLGASRSPLWEQTRKDYEKTSIKVCPVCGTIKRIELHHILPFHLYPALELVFTNLMWLCRDCHYRWGHLWSWRSYNSNVLEDTEIWKEKIKNRP